MDVSSSWTAHDWLNRGGELLDADPWLAKRLLARGLQIDPTEAIAWFNLGIGLHQQRRIAGDEGDAAKLRECEQKLDRAEQEIEERVHSERHLRKVSSAFCSLTGVESASGTT